MRLSISLILRLVLASAACAQTPGYRWERLDADEYALWHGSAQIGNLKDGEYRVRTAPGQWESMASDPPAAPPAGVALKKCGCSKKCGCRKGKCGCHDGDRCNADCKCAKIIGGAKLPGTVEKDGKLNFGVETKKIEHGTSVLNGKEVSKEEIFQAIGKPNIPHDEGLLCLTGIGDATLRQLLVRDFGADAYRNKIKLKDFDPSHWAVAGVGFVSPSVYLQAPNGIVLYRWDEYPGAAAIIEQLRIADPNYNPANDPPRGGSASDLSWLWWVLGSAAVIIGFGVFCLLAFVGLLVVVRLIQHKKEEA